MWSNMTARQDRSGRAKMAGHARSIGGRGLQGRARAWEGARGQAGRAPHRGVRRAERASGQRRAAAREGSSRVVVCRTWEPHSEGGGGEGGLEHRRVRVCTCDGRTGLVFCTRQRHRATPRTKSSMCTSAQDVALTRDELLLRGQVVIHIDVFH